MSSMVGSFIAIDLQADNDLILNGTFIDLTTASHTSPKFGADGEVIMKFFIVM
jgi:hypothetical protein